MTAEAHRPKVSVVMPCFNHASFVGEAAASVLAQTFADLELIAIDDASTDSTPDVLRALSDPRVRLVLRHENRGAHATINEGIALARGQYITVINSDDVFSPTRIAQLFAIAEASGTDVLGTDITLIGRDGHPISSADHYWRRWFEGLKAHLAAHGDVRRTLVTGNLFITTSNLFFSRRAFERIGPFADLRYTHDYEWAFRALDRGCSLQFVASERTLLYRLHGGNTILESPLAASRETFDVLLRVMPTLAGEQDRAVLEDLAAHLAKLAHDIEAVHLRTPVQRFVVAVRKARRALARYRR